MRQKITGIDDSHTTIRRTKQSKERGWKMKHVSEVQELKDKIIEFIGNIAQGVCEEVNMGDATMEEIRPRLRMLDYIIRKIRIM